jgi:hypothetical protein
MQEYKLVVRSLVVGATSFAPDGTMVNQNFSEFTSYLNENYLEQGYSVLSADFVSKVPAGEGSPVTYEFAYHLVKDYDVEEPKAKK